MLLKNRLLIENLITEEWTIHVDRIEEVSKNILLYRRNRQDNYFLKSEWKILMGGIASVITVWTGHTYVGERKSHDIEECFQFFFEQIVELVNEINHEAWSVHKYEKEFAKMTKYDGIIYRYLGSNDCTNNNIILPISNKIFVSWSKNKTSSYIKNKLYGPITWLKCNTNGELFGIDLEGVQNYCNKNYRGKYKITCGQEREVVFITVDSCIKEIKIIEYDDDGEEHISVSR